jgi:hypothetical protein
MWAIALILLAEWNTQNFPQIVVQVAKAQKDRLKQTSNTPIVSLKPEPERRSDRKPVQGPLRWIASRGPQCPTSAT